MRSTGIYRTTEGGGESVRAFVPFPLPPSSPPLEFKRKLLDLHGRALAAIGQLEVAGKMVPSPKWFLYGFVRKEALISSQIEGTQATLEDLFSYEATRQSDRIDDVEEVCNYIEAFEFGRREISRPKGLPLSTRLLCAIHRKLMCGVRGAERQPGRIRTSQNWIGGTRPGNAAFVPPPPEDVMPALADLERWIHSPDPIPPLIRAGLAHVQFESIHPFLDGNGRIGRLLISLLLEHWKILSSPLLYLSLAFKQNRDVYYRRLSDVRRKGDWEKWTEFFLNSVIHAAEDGVRSAESLFELLEADRRRLLQSESVTVPALRLFDILPAHPLVTLAIVMKELQTTKPTALKAIAILEQTGILREITGRKRDRVFAYRNYQNLLAHGTSPL